MGTGEGDVVAFVSVKDVVGPRDSLARFVQAIELQLRANDHKRGWSHLSDAWLLRRLRDETGELERTIEAGKSAVEIVREAADVAAFAMMIADNAIESALAEEPAP